MLQYDAGRTRCLDLHWKAVQQGIIYMDAQRMLDRRIVADGVNRLSPEDEFLHLVLHNLLRKGPLRPAPLQRIQTLLDGQLDWLYLRGHLDAFRLTPAFEAAVALLGKENRTAQRDLARQRRRLFWTALAARPGNFPRRVGVWIDRRWQWKRSGGLIALIGPDGAGKSTLIRAVAERARAIPTLKVDTTYLGPWGQMRLGLVPALRRAGITPTVDRPGDTRADRKGSPAPNRRAATWREQFGPPAKGAVFYGAIFIELLYRYVTSVFFKIQKGHWVISDRYITDLRYLYKERPIRNYEQTRELLCRFFPKPDLLIVLDNRSDVVAARKDGLTGGQIDLLRQASLKAARAYRHEVLTTDRPPDELADIVLQRMLLMRAGR